MTAVIVVIDGYRDATNGHPDQWAIQRAFSRHLDAHVTTQKPDDRRELTLTITGATIPEIAHAADFYLGAAQIPYQLRSAA